MSKHRILYVTSELEPFLSASFVSDYFKKLPVAMHDKGMEIRILVPRFGNINERKNRLHEVVRLSGITIAVGDEDKPLTIKVASIPTARLQVYFIDNEDYFLRKSVYTDKDNNFFADNDERAIFFCKGVLETVKKLGWSPDVVHCSDWISSLIPLYLKTTYKNDPTFKDAKTIFTVFDSEFSHKFAFEGLYDKIKLMDIEDEMLSPIDSADYAGFLKIGIHYADKITVATENLLEKYNHIFDEFPDKKIEYIANDEHFEDNTYQLYQDILA